MECRIGLLHHIRCPEHLKTIMKCNQALHGKQYEEAKVRKESYIIGRGENEVPYDGLRFLNHTLQILTVSYTLTKTVLILRIS